MTWTCKSRGRAASHHRGHRRVRLGAALLRDPTTAASRSSTGREQRIGAGRSLGGTSRAFQRGQGRAPHGGRARAPARDPRPPRARAGGEPRPDAGREAHRAQLAARSLLQARLAARRRWRRRRSTTPRCSSPSSITSSAASAMHEEAARAAASPRAVPAASPTCTAAVTSLRRCATAPRHGASASQSARGAAHIKSHFIGQRARVHLRCRRECRAAAARARLPAPPTFSPARGTPVRLPPPRPQIDRRISVTTRCRSYSMTCPSNPPCCLRSQQCSRSTRRSRSWRDALSQLSQGALGPQDDDDESEDRLRPRAHASCKPELRATISCRRMKDRR